MNKPKVLISKKLPEQVEAYLGEHCELVKWPAETTLSPDQVKTLMADVTGLMTSGTVINAELLDSAPHLRIVSNVSVGYNNFDTNAMRERGVIGTHTPYVLDDTVADLAFALMLAAGRRIAELDSFVKQGKWKRGEVKEEDLFGLDVHHATLGIVGMGRIGESIAKRAKFGFDMDVLYTSRTPKPDAEEKYGAKYRTLEQLLAESDYIVLITPLTPETKQMIGKKQFAMMKRSAVFINASRGATVDEQAMIEALQEGLIYAAGLDVYEQEPVDPDNPLLRMPNVVTLPHIGSATARTRFDMAMAAARNMVAGLTGQTPPNVVPELR